MKFGERVRQIRLSKNISMEEMAYSIGIEYSKLSRIERGLINTSLSHAFVIAEYFQITPKELFDFEIK